MNSLPRVVRLLVFWTLSGVLHADDWPQFGGPNRNFCVPESAAGQATSETIPRWSFPCGSGDDAPVIADGRVIVCEADFSESGTDAHGIVCREVATGMLLWRHTFSESSFVSQDISDRYPVRPIATCCLTGNRVLCVGYGGSVRCLSLESGESLWSHDLVQEFEAAPIQYGAATSPWSDGKVCIVACGGVKALLIAFSIEDGHVVWTAAAGPVSYTSLIELEVPATGEQTSGRRHLVYAAGDELIGVSSADGSVLWRFPYPNQGLTNAVTPLSLGPGLLLVGGQGFKGSTLLRVETREDGTSEVRELWCNSKVNPFYCNWVHLQSEQMIVGFAGKLLCGIDGETGTTLWQKRGWTDANITAVGADCFILRGDGVLARTKITRAGIDINAASRVVNDRVWVAPSVVGSRILVRGRTSLSCIGIDSLPSANEIPDGTNVTSMEAMYGNANERVSALIDAAKRSSDPLQWDDYTIVAGDPSTTLGESEYGAILKGLEIAGRDELALRISDDWSRRQPHSIPAWQNRLRWLKKSGKETEVRESEAERLVRIAFEVTVPESTPSDVSIYVAGNAAGIGNWQPGQFQLERGNDGKYRGAATVPKGDLQYKVTQGSWDSTEVRVDQRGISNRRLRITEPTTVAIKVQAWKDSQRKPE